MDSYLNTRLSPLNALNTSNTYEGRDLFKNYYTHKLVSRINPHQIQYFIAYFPFINYPLAKFNDEAKSIIERYYPNISLASALENVKANNFTREYIYACCTFMI